MNFSTVEIVIQGRSINVEVPTFLYDLVVERDELRSEFKAFTPAANAVGEILRSLLPVELRPPTAKQVSYATTIAKRLGMVLPANALRDANVCGNFISENAVLFDGVKESKKNGR